MGKSDVVYEDSGDRVTNLKRAFLALDPEELQRLLNHVERGTRILCGDPIRASLWREKLLWREGDPVIENEAFCPSILARYDFPVPARIMSCEDVAKKLQKALSGYFLFELAKSMQEEVYQAVREAGKERGLLSS